MAIDEGIPTENISQVRTHGESERHINGTFETHPYRMELRSQSKAIRGKESNYVVLVCNITEFLLQYEFKNYVKILLEESNINVISFYR